MILDAQLQFSSAQSLAQVVGTYASSNIVDWGVSSGIPTSANGGGARDMGIGRPIWWYVVVGTTFVSSGGGTLQIHLQGAADNGSGSPDTYATWWSSPLYTIAQMTAGSRLFDMAMPRPPDGVAIPRFTRLLYQVATATIDTGTISSYLVLDRFDQVYQGTDNAILGGYPAGLNVAN